MTGSKLWWLAFAILALCMSSGGLAKEEELEYDWEPEDYDLSDLLSARPQDLILRMIFPDHEGLRDLLCKECVAAAAAVDAMMATGVPVADILDLVVNECITLDLYPAEVCEGMITLAGYQVTYVLNITEHDYATCCGFLLNGHCNNTALNEFTLELPGGKPQVENPEPNLPPPKTIRIMHLTDPHVDLDYEEGAIATCDYPICCRSRFGEPLPDDPVGGPWGAYHCDIPLRTLDDLIYQASLLQPDLVYVTGDVPAHDVWLQTTERNLASINATNLILQKYFPNTPVLNCLGNHAPAPVNAFVVPAAYESGYNMDWLYEASVQMWSHWLPEDTFADVRRGGYFSYSPFKGFRVININMMCHHQNWWFLLENEDPTGQLQWLIDTLAAAEAAGEKVHILSHLHPGMGCEAQYNKNLNNIVTRFESTIRAMFHGDKHVEYFSLVYDPEDTLRPVAVGFVAPGGSALDVHQPAFKMYTVDGGYDGATWSVIDMQTYTMNLTLANEPGGQPEYLPRYTSQDAYNVSSLTAPKVDQLTLDMANDKELFGQYVRNIYNYQFDPPEMYTCPEDPDCYKRYLCEIVNTDRYNRDACQRLEAIIDGVHNV